MVPSSAAGLQPIAAQQTPHPPQTMPQQTQLGGMAYQMMPPPYPSGQPSYLFMTPAPVGQFTGALDEFQMQFHLQQAQAQQMQLAAQTPYYTTTSSKPPGPSYAFTPYPTYMPPPAMHVMTSSASSYYPSPAHPMQQQPPHQITTQQAAASGSASNAGTPSTVPLTMVSPQTVATLSSLATPLIGSKRKASTVSAASSALTQDSHANSPDTPARTRVKLEVGRSSPPGRTPSPVPPAVPHERGVSAGSHAQMRRHKHKEVEVRRRRKISNLFNELAALLECGPTDKASILWIAARYVRYAREHHGVRPAQAALNDAGDENLAVLAGAGVAEGGDVVSPQQNSNYAWRVPQQPPQQQTQQQIMQPQPQHLPQGHLYPRVPMQISMPMHPMMPLPSHPSTQIVMLAQPHPTHALPMTAHSPAPPLSMTPQSAGSSSNASNVFNPSTSTGSSDAQRVAGSPAATSAQQ